MNRNRATNLTTFKSTSKTKVRKQKNFDVQFFTDPLIFRSVDHWSFYLWSLILGQLILGRLIFGPRSCKPWLLVCKELCHQYVRQKHVILSFPLSTWNEGQRTATQYTSFSTPLISFVSLFFYHIFGSVEVHCPLEAKEGGSMRR